MVLPMNIANDLDGSLQLQQSWLVDEDLASLLDEMRNLVGTKIDGCTGLLCTHTEKQVHTPVDHAAWAMVWQAPTLSHLAMGSLLTDGYRRTRRATHSREQPGVSG